MSNLAALTNPCNATIVGTHEYAGCVGTVLKANASHVEIAFYDSRGGQMKWVGKRVINKQFIEM